MADIKPKGIATIIAKSAINNVPPKSGMMPNASLRISLSIVSELSITKALFGLQFMPNKKSNGLT